MSGSFEVDQSIGALNDTDAIYLGMTTQSNEIKNFFEKTI